MKRTAEEAPRGRLAQGTVSQGEEERLDGLRLEGERELRANRESEGRGEVGWLCAQGKC